MQSQAQTSRWRNALLSLHIAATAGALGMDLVMFALALAGWLGSNPLTVYPAAQLIAAWVLAPAAVTALATGLILTRITAFRITKNFWVAAKFTITIALNAAVFFSLLPKLRALAEAASGPQAEAISDTERLFPLLAGAGASSLLLVAIVLAVFKPRWQLFRRSTQSMARAS
jgi:hypothetical protein